MIPFYRPFHNHRELMAVLWPSPARDKFEAEVAARAGARYGLSFAYGRMALVAAVRALGLAPGQIVMPAYTCVVMAHAVMASGCRPAFVDIDLSDYNLDLSLLKPALSAQTRAVIATHMYGYPADVDSMRAILGDEKILIIEDFALGLHALLPGGGLRGDLGFFSFGLSKPLSSIEGGVLVTNSAAIAEKIRDYRNRTALAVSPQSAAKRLARFAGGYLIFWPPFYRRWYRRVVSRRPELNGGLAPELALPADYLPAASFTRYPHFQARIGLAQLAKLEQIVARRRELARLYDHSLRDLPGLHPAPRIEGATYACYTLRLPGRDRLNFRKLMAEQGVGVDQAFDYALPNLKAYRSFATVPYPRAAQAAREVVNLPCYPHLTGLQAGQVIAGVRGCLSRFRLAG